MFGEAKLIYRNRHGAEIEVVFSDFNLQESELAVFCQEENTQQGKVTRVKLKAFQQVELDMFQVKTRPGMDNEARMMANGFQSWSNTREMERTDKIAPLFSPASFAAAPYGDYHIYQSSGRKGLIHSWTYTCFRNISQPFLLLGSVDESAGYTIFEYDFNNGLLLINRDCKGVILKPGDEYALLDLYQGRGKEAELFADYFRQWNLFRKNAPACTGWTSWYNYYTNISEEIIEANLQSLKNADIAIDYFQIDDGYQQAVGDWLETNEKFAGGMKQVAERIRSRGFKPGLWLAPFICEPASRLFTEKPTWLLRDEKGNLVRAGWNPQWSGYFYALDFYADGVQEYLREVFRTAITDWGFEILKLDFLYAVALRSRMGKSKGQIMCEAMDFLHEIAGECRLLGCGVPMGPAFGKVDYCRIGCDVGPFWEFHALKLIGSRERISTVSSLQSTLGRYRLDSLAFRNDPDVFILRDGKPGINRNRLTLHQRYTLFMVNHLLGGLVFFSDDITEYTEEQLNQLRSAYPVIADREIMEINQNGLIYQVRFKAAGSEYLALVNLSGKSCRVALRREPYFHPDLFVLKKGDAVHLKPYMSICLRKVEPQDDRCYLLGASGHIYPGAQIEKITPRKQSITIKLHEQASRQTVLYIAVLPGQPSFKVNGINYPVDIKDGISYVVVKSLE